MLSCDDKQKTNPDNNVSEKGKERIPIPSNSESSWKVDILVTENKVVDRRYLKKLIGQSLISPTSVW